MKRMTYSLMKVSGDDGWYLKPGVTREDAYARLAEYEGTGLAPDQVDQIRRAAKNMMFSDVGEFVRYAWSLFDTVNEYKAQLPSDCLQEAAELLQKKQNGLLVELPCKVGDTVYQIRNKRHAKGVGISPRIISSICCWADGDYALTHPGMDYCQKKDFGKTWFLSREEAEESMKNEE